MDKQSSTAEQPVLKLTTKQVVVILVLFAVSLIAVGLLAGLVRPTRTSLPVRQPAVGVEADPWLNARLRHHVIPVHYELSLFPDFYRPQQDDAKFYGNVSILINITSRPTKHLIVHANKLTIHQTTVRLHETTQGESVHVQRAFSYVDNQYWVVELDADLQPGSAVWLDMQFDGPLRGKLSGLYRASYVDSRTGLTRFHLVASA